MIHVLTIFIMFLIAWNVVAGITILDDGSIMIYSGDDLFLKIVKIYWWIILVSVGLFVLWLISYIISVPIYCNINNNDDKVCIKYEENKSNIEYFEE